MVAIDSRNMNDQQPYVSNQSVGPADSSTPFASENSRNLSQKRRQKFASQLGS